jgi:hypothetical protein
LFSNPNICECVLHLQQRKIMVGQFLIMIVVVLSDDIEDEGMGC